MLNDFDILDFSFNPNIKYISGECSFGKTNVKQSPLET
jgi:hypothetical protein